MVLKFFTFWFCFLFYPFCCCDYVYCFLRFLFLFVFLYISTWSFNTVFGGVIPFFKKNSNISSLFLGVHLICMFSIKLSGKTSVPLFECTYCFWNCLALLSYCSILLDVAGILYFNSSVTSAIIFAVRIVLLFSHLRLFSHFSHFCCSKFYISWMFFLKLIYFIFQFNFLAWLQIFSLVACF